MVQLWGEKLFMPQEAADYLKYYKENTLAKWRCKKRGPAYIKIADGNIRYRRWDLIEWLHGQVVKPSQIHI